MKFFTLLIQTAIVAFLSLPSWGKPLYMTVTRDFGQKESPVIELAYLSSAPILLRIYSPKDLKAFVASQLDLRRAWKQPKSEFNPEHFLSLGYNASSLDLDWMRRGANIELRKKLKGQMGGAEIKSDPSSLVPGAERIIVGPEGFSLVKEMTVSPEVEDASNPFDVPGFNSWFGGRSSSFKTKMVSLPALPNGFYVVQTIQGDNEGQVVVVVNNLMAQFQQTSGAGLWRVVDRNGDPVSGAKISVKSLEGKWIAEGKTDSQGEYFNPNLKGTDLLTLVEHKGSVAIIDSEFFATTAAFSDLYLYTDRPMYRLGDPVSFRGILRDRVKGSSEVSKSLKSAKVKVQLQNLEGQTVGKPLTLSVNEFGTFTGKFQVTEESEEGAYRVVASLAGTEHSADLRIKEYVKPLIFVTVQSDREVLRAGDTLKAQAKVERYAGGVPSGAQASVQLYRVRMDAPQWVEDAGLGETGSVVTYGFDSGAASQNSVNLPVLVAESQIEFDDRGQASIELQVPKELVGPKNYDYQFKLVVTARDADENFASSSKLFSDLASDVVAQARFGSLAVESTAKQKLWIRSVTASGKPYPQSAGLVKFFTESLDGKSQELATLSISTDQQGRAAVDLPQVESGAVVARVVLADKAGAKSTTEARLIVANMASRVPPLSLESQMMSNQTEVSPDGKIRALLLLPASWGIGGKSEGRVYLTVAGRGIYERRAIQVSGHAAWIEQAVKADYGTSVSLVVSYPDIRAGWVERRSSYRIVDSDKKMKLKIQPAQDMVAPGGRQEVTLTAQTWDGKPVVAEFSVAVVDRSVLDLQPEIRPALMDFFYPADRLNLATFLSGQFQSYGYAEQIARMFKSNYGFAASKSASKSMDQLDTAYWAGQIKTNAQGEAKIEFDLPGNQTIWKVIAVAVDQSGRFGESQTEFKSQLPVSILLGTPAFLRSGDRSQVKVNLTSLANRPLSVSYRLVSENPKTVGLGSTVEFKGTLDPKGQKSLTAPLKAELDLEKRETQGLIGTLEVGNRPLKFRDTLKIYPGTLEQKQFITPTKSGEFSFQLSNHEKLESVDLYVTTGLMGTLLPSLRWLVRYPYGCVEQTVSALVPNIVFSQVLDRAVQNHLVLTKDEKQILEDAKAFSKSGVQKLLAFKTKEGGFSWWMGGASTSADRNMTLLVLTVLASASENVDLYSFADSLAWIKTQGITPASSEGIALSYIDGRFARRWVGVRNMESVKAQLRLQSDYALKSGTLMDRAHLLLALKSYPNLNKEFDRSVTLLSQAIRESLDAGAPALKLTGQSGAGGEAWPGYPGRQASTVALAVGALMEQEKDPKSVAAKYWQLMGAQFNGEYFGSTFETSMTLLMMMPLLNQEVQSAKNSEAWALKIREGSTQGLEKAAQSTARLGGFQYRLRPASLLKGNQHTLAVQGLSAQVSARMTVTSQVSMAQAKSVAAGWDVRREYYLLGSKGEKERVDPKQKKFKVGDLVWVRVVFARQKNFNRWQSRYYAVSDSVPAGFSVIEEDRAYDAAPFELGLRGIYKSRAIQNDRVRWYYDFSRGWMDREIIVGYVMRASHGGKFTAGVARVDDFYDEQNVSQTDAVDFDIQSELTN